MQLKVDLHVHTDASSDGLSSLQDMIRAAKRRGLDGIAVTDHNNILDAGVADQAFRDTGLLLIPGVEVSTASGHLLVLHPHRSFEKGSAFMDVVKNGMADNSVLIIPHPTDPFSHGVGAQIVKSSLPFHLPVEVMNASTLGCYNRSAAKLADELSLSKVGGSDAHLDASVGDAYTLVEASERSVNAVLAAIKAGRTSASGHQTRLDVTVQGVLRKILKRVKRSKSKHENLH